MSLRRKAPHDSLYMLLDTMCNAFGGIILMAVLVVILTSREKSQSANSSDSEEMLQRRLVIAEENLRKSLEFQSSLQAGINSGRWKSRVALLSTRQQLRKELEEVRDLSQHTAKEIEKSASVDPAEQMKELGSQLAAADAKKAMSQNSLAAANDNANRLRARLDDLEKQAAILISDSEIHLRLPKEHETGKRAMYVIARYGRLYCCRNSDLSLNQADIEWTSTPTGETAEPKKGRGIDPDVGAAALGAYFRGLSENSVYIAFCVFEDSFSAFGKAKKLAIKSGLSYGWEPYRFSDGPVAFSADGHAPKPQ